MEEKINFDKAVKELESKLLITLKDYLNDIRWLHKRTYKVCEKGKEYEKLNLRDIANIARNIDTMDDTLRNLWVIAGEIELLFEETKIRIPSIEISDEYRQELRKPLQVLDATFEVLLHSDKFDKDALYQVFDGIMCYGETKRVMKLLKKRIKYIEETPIPQTVKENKVEE